MNIREQILKSLSIAIKRDQSEINLEFPENQEHGDFSTNIALKTKTSAQELIDKLLEDTSLMQLIERIEIAGPGFINFFIKPDYLEEQINNINKGKDKYGLSDINLGKKVVVEYSSPNIAKPFSIAHLRSTIIGDAIANLLEATGWTVYRDNHLGDWGTQFGKQIYAIKTWGDEDKILNSVNPVKELVSLYVKFHEEAQKDESLEDKAREWFRQLEKGDPEARRIWQFCVDLSLKEFEKIYAQFGIKFTENDGKGYSESYFENKMLEILLELNKKGLLQNGDQGSKLVFFESDKYPPLMIIKKDGTTLYATRDLATDKFRLAKYGKDVIIINEVGSEQTLYFQQLFEIEKMLGWVRDGQRVHIKHGLFRFADKKMSTRKGDIIWLDEVLSQAFEMAKKFGSDDDLARKVSVGALKWNELKRDPIGDIVFDWEEILNMQGNSGPYIQYTYARTKSVIDKMNNRLGRKTEFDNRCEETLYPEEHSLMRLLSRFPEIITSAAKMYSPNMLAEYLFEVAQSFNGFYNKHKIIESQKEEFRLKLTQATGVVLKNGLKILGIEAPERM